MYYSAVYHFILVYCIELELKTNVQDLDGDVCLVRMKELEVRSLKHILPHGPYIYKDTKA